MSTFVVTTYLSGATLNTDELTNILGEVGGATQSASAGSGSVATASYTTFNSKSFAVEADDLILWHVNFSFSVSDTTCRGLVRLAIDGTTFGPTYQISHFVADGGGTGRLDFRSLTVNVQNKTGTPTFTFEAQRSSGSGNLYIGDSYMWFEVLKRKA